jgi:hypothetical protein
VELEVVDAEEQALRDLAVQTDRLEGRPVESEGAKEPEPPAPPARAPETPQVPEKETPDSSEPEPEPSSYAKATEDTKRDEKGRFKADKPPEVQPPVDDGQKAPTEAPERPLSKFAQAKEREAKEEARRERSWTALQQEKERLRAEQAKWEEQRRMEELQSQVQERPLVKDGIDFQGYQKAYQDFRAHAIKTDDPEAWKNALFSHETLVELDFQARQEQDRVQASRMELDWLKKRDAAFERDPDLQNPEYPLRQALERVMQRAPVLYYMPKAEGWDIAMETAELLLAAGSESELRDQLEQALAENEKLRRGSQPARGGPGKPPKGPKSEDDMSIEELEAHYAELSRQADAMR